MLRPRSTRRDLLGLLALCAVTYFLGLTTHGLTNWQESMRALVAREMLDNGEWIVPTVAGRPYLAKPPMFYWLQITLATILGGRCGELELRLAVALAGTAGVLATFFAARRFFAWRASDPHRVQVLHPTCADPHWPAATAWWSALMLASGFLYVRSSRIGELDILLVPFVVVSIWAIAEAWRETRRSVRWAWVLVAGIGAAGASLTKGPPAVMVIALAGYGGVLLHAACLPVAASRRTRLMTAIPATAAGLAAVLLGARAARTPTEWLAVVWFGALAAGAAVLLTRLAHPRRMLPALSGLVRTNTVLVIGCGLLSLWLWGLAVRTRVPEPDIVSGTASGEAADNLELFSLESPLNNLEAASYGVGVGSVAAIIGCLWLVARRPRLPAAFFVVMAWAFFNLAAFSALGRGTMRYLTPVWPGIAMLGAAWLVAAIDRRPGGRRLALAAGVTAAGLAIGQAWWYGYGREQHYAHRSPRAFMRELLRPERGVDRARLFSLDFWEPAVDFYADAHVRPVALDGPKIDWPGPKIPFAEFRESLRASGEDATVLLRATRAPGLQGPSPLERLAEEGLTIQTLPIEPRYLIDRRRTPVIAVRVSPTALPVRWAE